MEPRGSEALSYVLTVHRVLESGLRHGAGAELVEHRGPRMGYRELAERVEALASALEELGVSPAAGPGGMGDRVATLGWNRLWHLEAYLAAPMMGAVLHPVNARLAPLEIAYILNHARDKVLLVDHDLLGLVERVADKLEHLEHVVVYRSPGRDLPDQLGRARVHDYEELLRRHLGRGYDWPLVHEDTVASMSYTSGTTGLPKGVTHSHRQIVLHAAALGLHLSALLPEGYRLTRDSVVLHTVPMFHAYSWGLPYLATLLGAKQVYPARWRPGKVLELIEEEGVTHTAGVPTMLKMLLDAAEEEGKTSVLEGLVWMTGGSALPRGLAERARRLGVRIVGSYGMTEAAPVLTVSTMPRGVPQEEAWEELTLTAGVPLPLSLLRVVDEQGRGWGEVQSRAPWMTRGYYRDPEKTEKAWRGGWFHTGDIGYFDRRGFLRLVDRAKDVIKSGGEWISSLRLESLITTHPCVAEAAVVAAYHPKWQERPVAVVVPKQGCSISEKEVLDHLARFVEEGVIPKWWLPDKVVTVEELPKTSVGKVDKRKLRQQYWNVLVGDVGG